MTYLRQFLKFTPWVYHVTIPKALPSWVSWSPLLPPGPSVMPEAFELPLTVQTPSALLQCPFSSFTPGCGPRNPIRDI